MIAEMARSRVALVPLRRSPPQLLARVVIVVAVVAVSAVVLWVRQTPAATLRVHSFGGAALSVIFWAFPGLIAFMVVPRRLIGIAVSGIVLAGLTVAQWWEASTDRHSTASFGPGFTGWLTVPLLVVMGGLASRALHHRGGPVDAR
jgi:hypothetical protein